MITQKKYKICRRLGPGVYEKCQTQKFTLSQARKTKTRTQKAPKPKTDFGLQLIEKQRVRFFYGVSEKQFSNYVKDAMERTGKGISPSDELFVKLESRLDNLVCRMGFAHTRRLARQLVSHGHITVNGTKVTIPSYRVKKDDVIAIREGSKTRGIFTDIDKKIKNTQTPKWIQIDSVKLTGTVKDRPSDPDQILNFGQVIEFYSR